MSPVSKADSSAKFFQESASPPLKLLNDRAMPFFQNDMEYYMVEKNKDYTVTVESVSSDGSGVARIDGFTVFIPQTVDGDTALIQIVKVNKSFAYGRLLELLIPSPKRCETVCSAYKRCGGCQLRHVRYEEQLIIKKGIIENAMRRIGGFTEFKADGVVGMESPDRYRNKMVFPVGDSAGGVICGFYAQRSHDIIPLEDCALCDELCGDINSAVISYMNECGVRAYDECCHSGTVRRIFVRKSFSEGEFMVVVSVNADNLPHREKLVQRLRRVSDRIVSIILNINKEKNNLVLGRKNVTLWGCDRICDTLCGIKFMISAQSFFQINPVQTEKLYSKALELADLDGTQTVMDIYCGIGTISLCVARKAKRVIGVEIVKQAIEDAKENALNNNIKNVQFYADSAENIVPKLIAQGEAPDTVILDPPRKGSDEATLGAIARANPQKIVYVSCNPATLARDARFLADNGYIITSAQGFDLFPHTTHVETVILMERKND